MARTGAQRGAMGHRLARLALASLLVIAPPALAKGGGSHGSYSTGTHGHPVAGVTRDAHGKIARSPQARHDFQKSHPCPATGKLSRGCPGYIVDHIVPLKRGGADVASNMQWQTEAAARQKDKWE
jgi:hypothetical protein